MNIYYTLARRTDHWKSEISHFFHNSSFSRIQFFSGQEILFFRSFIRLGGYEKIADRKILWAHFSHEYTYCLTWFFFSSRRDGNKSIFLSFWRWFLLLAFTALLSSFVNILYAACSKTNFLRICPCVNASKFIDGENIQTYIHTLIAVKNEANNFILKTM